MTIKKVRLIAIGSSSATSVRMAAVRLKSANKNIFRALLSLASAALLIRVMGMLNQVVVSAHFGIGATMDAYFVASTIPLLLAGLLGGTVEAAVVPVYARVRVQGEKAQASRLFSTVLNLLLFGTTLLTVVLLIFRQQVLLLSAPGLDAFRLGLANSLAPFIYPVLMLMVVISFLECILNTEGQFGWPAYAGLLVPLTTAAFVLLAASSQGIAVLCIGMVVGLCLQLCVFIARAKRAKLVYQLVLDIRNPEITSILRTGCPLLLGLLISQGSPLVDQIFASFLSAGSISALNYALKLNSVFTGVIFVSVGRAILPFLSQKAAVHDLKAFKETLRLYLWVVGIGTTVLGVFMIVLAHPIVQILFQRGAFSAADTSHTATTLIGFMIGLTPVGFTFITVRAFNALGKNHIPVYLSIFSLVANALFDYIFAQFWQSEGIALATSAVYFCAMFILFFALRRTIGKLDLLTPPSEVLKVISLVHSHLHLRY